MWKNDRLPLWHATPAPRRRSLVSLLALVSVVCLVVFGVLAFWDPHVEVAFYSRKWIQQEVISTRPLAGCFSPERVSPLYNITEALYGRKSAVLHAGMPLRLGMDCYDFAGTIPPPTSEWEQASHAYIPPEERVQYHTYWRTDLAPFGERQETMLKSFFATQNIHQSRLTLWTNGRQLSEHDTLRRYTRQFPDSFTIRVVDSDDLARGTGLENSKLTLSDKKAWIDGDLVRLLVLWRHGGVWVDMDTLLTRDLAPLLEHEFVTQWDCYDKIYIPFNGALMHFRQHSPYLCEAFHIMSTSPLPRRGTTDWGATLYLKLWRRLVAASIPPFSVLPFCFADGRSCRLDNRLPDPFEPDPPSGTWTQGMGREEGGGLDAVLGKVFSVHMHNQWSKKFPEGGWVRRLLLNKYDEWLAAQEGA